MRAILIKQDFWSYVDGTTPCPEGDAASKWKTMDQKACAGLGEAKDGKQETSMFNSLVVGFNYQDMSNEWCLDSGCSSHLSANKESFETIKKIDKSYV